ncbi:MAG: M48 family metalloprotease [bacterium]
MPFSFIDIEERKTRQILLLFVFLMLLYFFSAWILVIAVRAIFLLRFSGITSLKQRVTLKQIVTLSPKALLIIFAAAFAVGIVHWIFSTHNSISRIQSLFKAESPDKEDRYHRILQNIVDEVCVATGGKKIECVVLPSYGMNAFSVADFNGRAVIGVTEGLLSRLSRAQLEAVIAHEAAHILTQDTLLKTIAVSLFSVYGMLCEQLRNDLHVKGSGYSSFGREIGGMILYMAVIYIVALHLYALTKLMCMFISRQCEYRADAVAVRLVRDPLSLAQALYFISSRWRGGGMGYDFLESLFIINPNYHALDERENVISNLFSTHPPIKNRISILLDMGHGDFKTMKMETQGNRKPRHMAVQVTALKESRWYVMSGIKWEGPFSASEVTRLGWVRCDSFVRREGTHRTMLLSDDQKLCEVFRKGKGHAEGEYFCPRCCKPLNRVLYEGAPVYHCDHCTGTLIEQNKIPRIVIREEQGFSEVVIRDAELVKKFAKTPFSIKRVRMQHELLCPRCKRIMLRKLYSLVYPIEVDVCTFCKMTWFDKHELEILQYLIEKADEKSSGSSEYFSAT